MAQTRRIFLARTATALSAALAIPRFAAAAESESIKIIHFFARKKGMTPEQFVEYWLKVHGPMTLKVPGRFSGYVLADAVGVPADAPPDAIIGVSESFSPDAAARLQTMSSPQAKALVADQDNFIGKSRSFTTHEHVFVARTPKDGVIKRVLITVRKAGISHQDFVDHWLKAYGPMAGSVPGLDGFVLSEITGPANDADVLALSGEIDGIAEEWWNGDGAPQPSPALQKWNAEADKFIDREKSILLVVRDHTLIPPHYG